MTPTLVLACGLACALAAPAEPLAIPFPDPVEDDGRSSLGAAIAVVGDLDGDGVADVATGDRCKQDFTGVVYLLSGADGATLGRLRGQRPGEKFGVTLAAPGDLDGDGIGDVVVGASAFHMDHDEGTPPAPGRVTAWSGETRQLLWQVDVEPGRYTREWDGLGPGPVLAVLPDRDGDGVAELAVGSTRADAAAGEGADDRAGHGADGEGVDQAANGADLGSEGAAVENAGAVRVLSGATGALLVETRGAAAGDRLGSAIASLDDLDGDGVPDLAVGSCPTGIKERDGSVLFLSGADLSVLAIWQPESNNTFTGVALALLDDRDGDGLRDLAVGSPWVDDEGAVALISSGTREVLARWRPRTDHAFGGVLAAAPDLDGDGVADLLVSAPTSADFSGENQPLAWLLSGAGDEELLAWNHDEGFMSYLGIAMTPAGDLDGDGVPDILLGAATVRGADSFPGMVQARSGADGSRLWHKLHWHL
jgi:hypothetical protein